MQATQVTFPIISCPLDYVAFQAFIVPPGNAAIATVGIEKQIPHKKEYVHSQREKALLMAEKMLNLEGAGVELSVGARFAEEAKKIEGELQKLGIRTGSSQLRLIYDYALSGSSREGAINLFAGSYLPQITIDGDEARIRHCPDTLQVHGATNLAVYAAKILSLQDSAIREKLKKMAADKRATYGGGRALDAEFQCMTAAGRGE
jgi:phosphoribosylcarboxyaminoimidazole (NCAIR) mutase